MHLQVGPFTEKLGAKWAYVLLIPKGNQAGWIFLRIPRAQFQFIRVVEVLGPVDPPSVPFDGVGFH